ncbi:MAG: tRNA-uridine aminocarboxypropyltransferase [Fuerstiella sp.]
MTAFQLPVPAVVTAGHEPRERCYSCYRPKTACFCDAIPSVDNKTRIVILQHVKERFHAFNTARIVRQALKNCDLLVDQTSRLARLPLPSGEDAGVLYPGARARRIDDVPPDQRPRQLVILDGTWHHAKTMMRDIPGLQQLPRYRLNPTQPGRYRIRREPNASALSTIEATVAALRVLEPELQGLDRLLAAFDRMIDEQIQHPQQAVRLRRRSGPPRPALNIPSILLQHPEDVVVAYGESANGRQLNRRSPPVPIYWVAQRLISGELFECAIRPPHPLTPEFLAHLELHEHTFNQALTAAEFRESWQAFVRKSDTLCTFNESTSRLLTQVQADFLPALSLKAVNVRVVAEAAETFGRECRSLDQILAALNITSPAIPLAGRSAGRLANAVAFAQYLSGCAVSRG